MRHVYITTVYATHMPFGPAMMVSVREGDGPEGKPVSHDARYISDHFLRLFRRHVWGAIREA